MKLIDRSIIATVLAVAAIIACMLLPAACATVPAVQDGIMQCGTDQAKAAAAELQELMPAILDGDKAAALAALTALAKKHGELAVTCAVNVVLNAIQGKALSPADAKVLENGKAWLDSRPYRVAG